jgi:hypothetical protein
MDLLASDEVSRDTLRRGRQMSDDEAVRKLWICAVMARV